LSTRESFCHLVRPAGTDRTVFGLVATANTLTEPAPHTEFYTEQQEVIDELKKAFAKRVLTH